ncbi:hypothetical protein BSFA1_31410 [Burkholderia sp. SFA1]|nr:hypothetical protein BSFA1_31410 [Burkholderia sp. SFA1]
MIGDAKARARFLRSGRDTAASAASETVTSFSGLNKSPSGGTGICW